MFFEEEIHGSEFKCHSQYNSSNLDEIKYVHLSSSKAHTMLVAAVISVWSEIELTRNEHTILIAEIMSTRYGIELAIFTYSVLLTAKMSAGCDMQTVKRCSYTVHLLQRR